MASGDVTISHGTSVAYTISLASLADSATRVVGRESTAVALAAPMTDILIGGKIETGTTPTVDELIDIWVYASLDDAPNYPEDFTGSDAAVTIASVQERNSVLKLLHSIRVTASTGVVYEFGPFSLAALFGGVLPTHHGLFVSQSTDVNLDSTGGNHVIEYTPVYMNVTP